jgi:hypothetical protein
MTGYLIKKAAALAAVLFLVSLTVFSVLFVLPGDPAQIILGMNASPETLAALRSRLGLDQPFLVQYGQLDRQPAERHRRPLHHLRHTRREPDRLPAGGDRPAGPHGHGHRRGSVPAPGDFCRPPSEPPR